jgi:MoxR-like ATPase
MAQGKTEQLRHNAEIAFREELDQLKKIDKDNYKPKGWELSPRAVVDYVMGRKDDDIEVSAKYIGDRRKIEVAVATLASNRALLLVGVPGTAKTWLAEHLTAAISGDSKHIVQGTSGMYEEALRYSWNYAELLAKGPSESALVPSPVLTAMQEGKIARIEELTRIPSDVQDSLIMILSEKILPVPELNMSIPAIEGFNVIATANEKDRGVHELSSALQRRFNMVHMPLPDTHEEEVEIVHSRLASLTELPPKHEKDIIEQIKKLVQVFRELRSGITSDKEIRFQAPGSTLSSAEAISVMQSALALSQNFSKGKLGPRDISSALAGTIVKNTDQDRKAWNEYLELVMKKRKNWKDWYEACRQDLEL